MVWSMVSFSVVLLCSLFVVRSWFTGDGQGWTSIDVISYVYIYIYVYIEHNSGKKTLGNFNRDIP